MLENIFLTYANVSLRNNPKMLLDIYEEFINSGFADILPQTMRFKQVLRYVLAFARINDLMKAERVFKKKQFTKKKIIGYGYAYKEGDRIIHVDSPKGSINRDYFSIAFEGVYGYRKDCDFCQYAYGDDRKKMGLEKFERPERLKCHECAQVAFRLALKDIIAGKHLNEFIGTGNFPSDLSYSHELFLKRTIRFNEDDKYIEYYYYTPNIILKYLNEHTKRELLRRSTYAGFILISLVEFLRYNDRRKLKLCNRCDKFFIAKKIDTRIKYCPDCSRKSPLTGEDRRIYQREYYKKKKQEKLTKQKEDKIANYMDKLECTREEAEKIIEADSRL